ncbi:MAG: pyridoxamine 5'-phosphate oxidase [Candidatus Endobugula sp.]|jgi:pyridoxamine 5'-phosphate oxidase
MIHLHTLSSLFIFYNGALMQLQDYRREYVQGGLRRKGLNASPIAQFETWLQQAIASGLSDPTAMTLATVDENGQPNQRIVLLKQVDEQGFVFFTNKQSIKGKAIASNPNVSLHFPWYPLERQVRVQGTATLLDEQEVASYFASRPKDSQLAAWASEQSQVIPSRDHLLKKFNALQEEYAEKDAPLPTFWGGYRVKPACLEFWQGGEHRLHDRFQYKQNEMTSEWDIDRLAP